MRFKTLFNGYSLAFSPFMEGRLAVTTSQNFGIIGNGQQYVLEVGPNGLTEVARFETADGLYDCCWSEENENILVSASGDGSVKVWDVAGPPQMNPLRSFEEHTHEVYAVHWNQVRRDCFLSASWDDTVKLWSLNGGAEGGRAGITSSSAAARPPKTQDPKDLNPPDPTTRRLGLRVCFFLVIIMPRLKKRCSLTPNPNPNQSPNPTRTFTFAPPLERHHEHPTPQVPPRRCARSPSTRTACTLRCGRPNTRISSPRRRGIARSRCGTFDTRTPR